MKKDSELAAARGKRLREAFALDETSPLKWRKLRNVFEHFDEDLDRFLLHDRAGYIFKLVDPEHGICVLLREKFEFRPIRQEVGPVLTRALEMDDSGARF